LKNKNPKPKKTLLYLSVVIDTTNQQQIAQIPVQPHAMQIAAAMQE
jgi:hypothetical protein